MTGFPIIPRSIYDIVAMQAGTESSQPTIGKTQLKPGVKWFGDSVGFFCGVAWTPPDSTSSIDDTVAAIKAFQNPNAFNAPPLSVADIHPLLSGTQINKVVNFDDVFAFIQGFLGLEYPGPGIDLCMDP